MFFTTEYLNQDLLHARQVLIPAMLQAHFSSFPFGFLKQGLTNYLVQPDLELSSIAAHAGLQLLRLLPQSYFRPASPHPAYACVCVTGN